MLSRQIEGTQGSLQDLLAAAPWIPADETLWKIECFRDFLEARKVLPEGETMRRARLAAMAGNAALADDRYDAALASLDLAKEGAAGGDDPKLTGGIEVDRARALANLGRMDDAGTALSAARGEDPDNPEAWLLSATLARRENKLAEAQD